MSGCTDPLMCERAGQATKLAHQAVLKLTDGATQLRLAKIGSEAQMQVTMKWKRQEAT